MESMKLTGGVGATSATGGVGSSAPVKVDGNVKRRPKSAKRKKLSTDASSMVAGGSQQSSVSTPGMVPRLDGGQTPGAKSDSGVKLETGSGGVCDESIGSVHMNAGPDTWQRNGHSADFIRHSLDGMPSGGLSSSSGPGSAPPPSSCLDNITGPASSSSAPPPSKLPPFANCGPPSTSSTPGPTMATSAACPSSVASQRLPVPGQTGAPNVPVVDGPGAGGMSGFLSQQSQVFVFSTRMANQAAEAVDQNLCRTIIDYHLEQPSTRQFLQNLSGGGPLTSQHYAGPPFGPPDGPGPAHIDPGMGPPPSVEGGASGDMGGGSALANVELWVQQQNASLQEGPFSPSFGPSSQPMPPGHRTRSNGDAAGGPPRCCPGPHHSGVGGEFGPGPNGDPMFGAQPPPGYGLDHQHLMRGIGAARVPDENLTPEQLQRREEQLAHLQKIKQMLFPEKPGGGGFEGGPPGRYPGGPPPGMYRGPVPPDDMPGHHHMMGQPPRFMHPGGSGMMVPPGAMMDQPMPPDGMVMMGGMGPPFGEHGLPPNWDMMTNEEREWFKLQQEYYMEQRQKRQMQLQQMAGGPGHPPGFFADMPRPPPGRSSGPLSPVSPSFNGASPNDPQGYFLQGQPGMNFPPGRPNFPPNGPGGPPFNPDFVHHPDGGFPPYGNPMMMQEPGGAFPGNRFPAVCGKPKRKRGNAAPCMPCPPERPGDDIFRHLQPAPSPQQFCSLNLFDGQELTITKQLNLAYQEPTTSASPSTQPHSSTPPTTAPARKKKKSNNDVRIKSELSDASVLSPVTGPSASETGDSTGDQSVVSPSVSKCARSGNGSGPITSATLASLARGVESLSDRIQADMLRGGPFGAVQMPEPDEIGEGEDRRSNAGIDARGQLCSNDGGPLHTGDQIPTSDQSLTSIGMTVKPDPSTLLSPQSNQIESIPPSSRMPGTSCPSSVQSPSAMVGNASVQIEPRAPNTIQYLPARPPTSSDLGDPGPDRCMPPRPDGGEPFRQLGPGQFCPNGPGMGPPPFDGPIPPGYDGPLGRFDGPPYGEPLSPSAMIHRGCGPMQYQGGDMMFPDGGPIPFSDGHMMHSGTGPMPYHGGRPMFYRGGPVPHQGGPMYRPGQPPGMMMHPDFRECGPERHGQLMSVPRPNPGSGQMIMMGPARPVMSQEQPPVPPNPAPSRSRAESRSKKSKESKRRAEAAAAAARQNAAMCDDTAAMMGGRPDPRGPMGHYGGPGPMPGPPMGFPPGDGPGMMPVDRMRAGPMMIGPDGSPGMIRHPVGDMMIPVEEFEMMQRTGGGPPGMMTSDGRVIVPRGGPGSAAMRSDPAMMMMMAGKGGMRPGDGDMMPGGPHTMMAIGPHDIEMRGEPGMMCPGDMRPGSGMMPINDMRGGMPVMMGPNDMRSMPPGMMGPRPGSGMMPSADMRPGSAVLGSLDGRPGSGAMLPGDMNPGPTGPPPKDQHRPGSGMIVMSPRDDIGSMDGNRSRQANCKANMPPSSDGSRPESVGKRSEADLIQMSADAGVRGGLNIMTTSSNAGRPSSKLQSLSENDLRPNSVGGMDLMDGMLRPGSAAMMGPGVDGRPRVGDMMMNSDGSMRPGSALMMGMGPGDGPGMRMRSDMIPGLDPMEMGLRPGSDMMQMGPGDCGPRGAMLMGINAASDGGMRPGPDMIGMSVSDGRMRPGSAAMMMGMGPTSEAGVMGNDPGLMMMGPGAENMQMMAMSQGDFDPRGCPPELLNAQRMGLMGQRMMNPGDPAMRYDGAGPLMPVRMHRPRGEIDFRMMGMESNVRGMRNGGVYPPPDRQMMMMMNSAGQNSGLPMPPNDFGPGMGSMPMGPGDGAPFQQFQQQLYASKGHHPQQGPGSPLMMMDIRASGPGSNIAGFDPMQNGPPVRFGPPGSGVM